MKITKTIDKADGTQTIIEADSAEELLVTEQVLKTGLSTMRRPHLVPVTVPVKDGYAVFKGEKYPSSSKFVVFPDACYCTEMKHWESHLNVIEEKRGPNGELLKLTYECGCESHSE